MTASMTPGDQGTVRCAQCDNDVPALDYCVICGHPLADELQSSGRDAMAYSAAPDEPVVAVRLFTTLFPQLPKADLDKFRIAFAFGALVIVALIAAGLYPVALVAAAAIVPLLFVLYMVDVDVYEDEPARVVVATIAWGAIAGALAALAINTIRTAAALEATGPDASAIAVDGIVVPLVTFALILVGPMALLRYRRFNDVLDGTTFGVASAVAFSGAFTLVSAIDILRGGLRPTGDPLPWVLTLLTVGLIRPILYATAAGGTCAALWLHFRAPVRDRNALGLLSRPVLAAVVAVVLLVAAALAGLYLDQIGTVTVGAILAVAGLVWLRRAIHLGLLQESRERPIGSAIRCANCGRSTPHHTFCGRCGIALKALPKGDGPETPPADLRAEPR